MLRKMFVTFLRAFHLYKPLLNHSSFDNIMAYERLVDVMEDVGAQLPTNLL